MEKQAIFESYCATQQAQINTTNHHHQQQPPSSSSSSIRTDINNDNNELGGGGGGRLTPPRDLEQEEGLEGTLVSDELELEAGGEQENSIQVKDQILQAMEDQLVVPSTFPTPPSSQPSPTTPSNNQALLVVNSNSNSNGPASAPVPRPAQATVFSSIEAGRGEYASRQAQNESTTTTRMDQQHHVVVAQPVKTSDSHPIK